MPGIGLIGLPCFRGSKISDQIFAIRVMMPNSIIKGLERCLSGTLVWTLGWGFERVERDVSGIFGCIITSRKTTPPGSVVLGRFLPNPKLRLREQLAEVCRFRHMSHRSEDAYWHWIKGFIQFYRDKSESKKQKAEGDGEHSTFNVQLSTSSGETGGMRCPTTECLAGNIW